MVTHTAGRNRPVTLLALLLILAVAATLVTTSSPAAADDPAPPGTAPDDQPDEVARLAAGWLARQLVDGQRLEGEFGADVGLTADAVFALAAAGVGSTQLTATIDWLGSQAAGYTRGVPFDADDAVYAGATAKLLLALLVDDRQIRSVGGRDLVAQLLDREQPDGRFTDSSQFGEFSSTLTQSLAVLALVRADGVDPSPAAVGFLLDQQCDDGGFRFDPDQEGCTSAADTTALVVQALLATGTPDNAATAREAVGWLVAAQDDAGALLDAGIANANSTGLAAVAYALLPEVDGAPAALAAARAALLGLWNRCGDPAPGAIAFSATDAGDLARATTQAIPGLTGVGLLAATSAGAVPEVAALLPFSDVTPGGVHAEAICELTFRGIVRGLGDERFAPAQPVTRGQAATLLAGVLGLEAGAGRPFTDVPASSTHAPAIAALAARGIVTGRSDGSFAPHEPLRRDQAASLLARAFELPPGPAAGFGDVAADNAHRDAIDALVAAGVAQGTGPDTFAPAQALRRDQLASLLWASLPVDAVPAP